MSRVPCFSAALRLAGRVPFFCFSALLCAWVRCPPLALRLPSACPPLVSFAFVCVALRLLFVWLCVTFVGWLVVGAGFARSRSGGVLWLFVSLGRLLGLLGSLWRAGVLFPARGSSCAPCALLSACRASRAPLAFCAPSPAVRRLRVPRLRCLRCLLPLSRSRPLWRAPRSPRPLAVGLVRVRRVVRRLAPRSLGWRPCPPGPSASSPRRSRRGLACACPSGAWARPGACLCRVRRVSPSALLWWGFSGAGCWLLRLSVGGAVCVRRCRRRRARAPGLRVRVGRVRLRRGSGGFRVCSVRVSPARFSRCRVRACCARGALCCVRARARRRARGRAVLLAVLPLPGWCSSLGVGVGLFLWCGLWLLGVCRAGRRPGRVCGCLWRVSAGFVAPARCGRLWCARLALSARARAGLPVALLAAPCWRRSLFFPLRPLPCFRLPSVCFRFLSVCGFFVFLFSRCGLLATRLFSFGSEGNRAVRGFLGVVRPGFFCLARASCPGDQIVFIRKRPRRLHIRQVTASRFSVLRCVVRLRSDCFRSERNRQVAT